MSPRRGVGIPHLSPAAEEIIGNGGDGAHLLLCGDHELAQALKA